jgi:energy-coupling factor transport system permease protein
MLNTLCYGRYIDGRSLLHRTDPRTKIALTLLFISAVFIAQSYTNLLLMLLFSFLIAWQSGRPLANSLKGLKPIIFLAIFTASAHLLFGGGGGFAESGLLSHLSRDGAGRAVKMILRLTVLVSGSSLLTCTTTPLALTDGLRWLLNPLRRIGLPVSEIATMMSLSLRFIPVIAEETERLIKADPCFHGKNLAQKAKSIAPLLLPLFSQVVRRGEALATAMDARCFGACQNRTRMEPLRFSAADLSSSGVMLLFLVSLSFF